jgi:hypothetical protein
MAPEPTPEPGPVTLWPPIGPGMPTSEREVVTWSAVETGRRKITFTWERPAGVTTYTCSSVYQVAGERPSAPDMLPRYSAEDIEEVFAQIRHIRLNP